jgi:hypothetical protein
VHRGRREPRGARRGNSPNGGDARPDDACHRGREPSCRSFFSRKHRCRPRATPSCAVAALAESPLDPARRRWCSRRPRHARRLNEW